MTSPNTNQQIMTYNPYDIFSQQLNMSLAGNMKEILKNFNIKTIAKLLIILCLYEIKNYIIELLTVGKTNIKPLFTNLLKIIKRIFIRKQIKYTESKPIYNEYVIFLKKDTISNIINFIETNNNCFYKILNTNIDYTTRNIICTNTYTDITINYSDSIILIQNNLKSNGDFSEENNKLTIVCDDNFSFTKKKSIYLIAEENNLEHITRFFNNINTNYHTFFDTQFKSHYSCLSNCVNQNNCMSFKYFRLICSLFSDYQLIFYYYITLKQKIDYRKIIDKYNKTLILDTPFFNVDVSKLYSEEGKKGEKSIEHYHIHEKCFFDERYYNTYIDNPKLLEYVKNIYDKTTKTDSIKFMVRNNSEQSTTDIIKQFLSQVDSNKTSKIKIYQIQIDQKKEIEEIDNPEYQAFQENKDMINKLLEKGGTIQQLPNIPPQKIKNIISVPIVKSTFINERRKSFDTLYLKQKDEQLLKQLLDNYNNNNIFDKLGLPKKLGILLHGVPGTGKSTTIQVIASYLMKDLYYININNVKTCADLKMMFDYVVKNCNNGGILVFEDIDAQTDIVHDRNNVFEKTLSSVVENEQDKLNLSYFLNLLDGTLCSEGTLFIMTTNHIDKLDKALYRKGRIDLSIELQPCDKYQIRRIYKNVIGEEIDEKVLNEIKEFVYPPCDVIFHLLQYTYNKSTCREMMNYFIK